MAWIKTIGESEATGPLAEVYAEMRKKRSFRDVPEGEAHLGTPLSVFTPNGASLKGLMAWSDAVRFGKSDLSRAQREMVATVTSVRNHCVF